MAYRDPWASPAPPSGETVNDHHSRLNAARMLRVERPTCVAGMRRLLERAREQGFPIAVAGGRHAMGGQQFVEGGVLLDTTGTGRVLGFDREAGIVEVDAGICWPELMAWLAEAQRDAERPWGIRQKQTGADRLTIGGTLAANAHGRGLTLKPFIDDVESFTLLGADGELRICSRGENRELFSLAIGGYGLLGIVVTVKLRLMRRRKLERLVSIMDLTALVPAVEERIADGCLYGDFQFAIDPESDDFLRRGVFSCYRTLPDDATMPDVQRELDADDWLELLYLAHEEKSRAFRTYSEYYRSTHGQRYWSDTHQLSEYLDDYHARLDDRLVTSGCGTEMITEIYVPRDRLNAFMACARSDLRGTGANVIYGTIRFIEADTESFLPWARDRYACIIFNLHTSHAPAALQKTAADFRRLIDRAIEHGGGYYLTYHRWASRRQVEICYPELPRFLALKRRYDPEETFQSDWYRHYRAMFADALG